MPTIDKYLTAAVRQGIFSSARPTTYSIPQYLAPAFVQSRQASVVASKKTKKKANLPKDFKRHNLQRQEFPQFTLCEAMRILRAYEVGQPPGSVKYEIHINLKTLRSGPVVKSLVRLPNPIARENKVAVICPEGSEIAAEATAAGAVLAGEESIFEAIRQEKIDFDRLICHESSEKALIKAGLGRILGPKGLMPSARMNTIVSDVTKSIRESAGASEYRERQGVIRLAVGQLAHNPEQLKANIQAVLKKIKSECAEISEDSPKEVHEVILSTTNGPALSLSGKFHDANTDVPVAALSGIM
ncbi:Putative 60S ribosomal protein L1 [[Torrubiella] hemipterigena]|uniref:Putative 60S ribosomal protein L1 n=1 Tax=[Torrubiella] hemipterigena TaxID=1531966 RepID=A0A0A1TJ83_9HYPO|nr:Putative 60S ribosomal protein L1 [[Torrubiella] hemipterigena]